LLDDVVGLASPEAARNGVKIETIISRHALPVKADSDLLKQALLNIVLNGVQSMEHGGTLTVTAEHNGARVILEVRDQGSGIPADIHDKVYNLFFTTKKEGSGIGLALSYRVMQMHGGSLEFESEVGRGTVFHLTLPLTSLQTHDSKEVVTAR
jgi:signal transduction histidine kinase